MAATKVLIVLVGASVLLVSQQERGLLQNSSVSCAGQAGSKSEEVIRDRLKNGGDGPEMVVISAGRFRMGDIQGKGGPDERPIREVHMGRPFAVSRYEITFDQYDEFAKATKRELPEDEGFGRGRRPVIYVSWDDAVAYAGWLKMGSVPYHRLETAESAAQPFVRPYL